MVGWLVGWFYGISTLFGSFNAELNQFDKSLYVSRSSYRQVCIWGAYDKFPDFFVQAFTIVIDSWKFTMLLLYILWDDWPILMISGSNEQLQQQLEYTLLKPDCPTGEFQKGNEDT